MINAIAAVDANWGIGYNNQLLARIPEDQKFFREMTEGNVVIMGRRTWDSLPRRPLPNRTNIIISSQGNRVLERSAIQMKMQDAIEYLKLNGDNEEHFVIGGGQIYKALLPYCDHAYITKIHYPYENVDTYFPNLDNLPDW